jgi:hypothetical protein
LKDLVEAFAQPLTKYLYDEIETLPVLDTYDSEEISSSLSAIREWSDGLRHILIDVNF